MHITIKNRLAFSMLELIFVIVILGIVSSIGAEVIAKVYENYIVQRAQHRASVKSQIAINLIANRLRYVVPGTMVRRAGIGGTAEYMQDSLTGSGDSFTVLQWVGTDGDSFEAMTNASRRPGWSGFCDLNLSTPSSIVSPGSDFTLTNTIQTNLGRTGNGFSIFFPNDPIAHTGTGAGNTITLDNNVTPIVERYKLAWSSYALVVEDNGDFNLYYNFSPTPAVAIPTTNRSLLLKDVTNFKFERRGQTTRIKLCVEEDIGNGVTIPSCKEKAVF